MHYLDVKKYRNIFWKIKRLVALVKLISRLKHDIFRYIKISFQKTPEKCIKMEVL